MPFLPPYNVEGIHGIPLFLYAHRPAGTKPVGWVDFDGSNCVHAFGNLIKTCYSRRILDVNFAIAVTWFEDLAMGSRRHYLDIWVATGLGRWGDNPDFQHHYFVDFDLSNERGASCGEEHVLLGVEEQYRHQTATFEQYMAARPELPEIFGLNALPGDPPYFY